MCVLSHTRSFLHNEAVVGVLILVAFGLTFESIMNWIMRRYFPWYSREGQGTQTKTTGGTYEFLYNV